MSLGDIYKLYFMQIFSDPGYSAMFTLYTLFYRQLFRCISVCLSQYSSYQVKGGFLRVCYGPPKFYGYIVFDDRHPIFSCLLLSFIL